MNFLLFNQYIEKFGTKHKFRNFNFKVRSTATNGSEVSPNNLFSFVVTLATLLIDSEINYKIFR